MLYENNIVSTRGTHIEHELQHQYILTRHHSLYSSTYNRHSLEYSQKTFRSFMITNKTTHRQKHGRKTFINYKMENWSAYTEDTENLFASLDSTSEANSQQRNNLT